LLNLNVDSEVVLFLGTLKWLTFNWNHRKEFAVPLLSRIQFSEMTLIQVVSCFFPPILPEVARIPTVRANLDLALYNVQMRIEMTKSRRKYVCITTSNVAPLNVWISDLEGSLHQISSENESKVYGTPIEQDHGMQGEQAQWNHLRNKNKLFQSKLKESINLIAIDRFQGESKRQTLPTKSRASKKRPDTTNIPIHRLKYSLKSTGVRSVESGRSSNRVSKLPIDYYDWVTCDCFYGLHGKGEMCSFGVGMKATGETSPKLIESDVLDAKSQVKLGPNLFSQVKRPHRYTLSYSGVYFGKALHQKRIQLTVEYMSLLMLGSPLTGFGYEYIWRLDLGQHVYAPVNWYTFSPLLPIEHTKSHLTWSVDAAAIDWHDELLMVAGRTYRQRKSIAMKREDIGQIPNDDGVNVLQMPAVLHSPTTVTEDELVLAEHAGLIFSGAQLPLTQHCYMYSPTCKTIRAVGSLCEVRINHSIVKCTIDHEEGVLAIGGENESGK
jgi:hypothetical protein